MGGWLRKPCATDLHSQLTEGPVCPKFPFAPVGITEIVFLARRKAVRSNRGVLPWGFLVGTKGPSNGKSEARTPSATAPNLPG